MLGSACVISVPDCFSCTLGRKHLDFIPPRSRLLLLLNTVGKPGLTAQKGTTPNSSHIPRAEKIFPLEEVIADHESSLVSGLLMSGLLPREGDPGRWGMARQEQCLPRQGRNPAVPRMGQQSRGRDRPSHCQLVFGPRNQSPTGP